MKISFILSLDPGDSATTQTRDIISVSGAFPNIDFVKRDDHSLLFELTIPGMYTEFDAGYQGCLLHNLIMNKALKTSNSYISVPKLVRDEA